MTTRLISFFVYLMFNKMNNTLVTKFNYDLRLFRGSFLTQKGSFRCLHRDSFSRLSQVYLIFIYIIGLLKILILFTVVRETD